MSTISLRIPDSLHKKVKDLAVKEHISINQFIASAVGEKIAAFMTKEYLEERAKQGSKEKFERPMAKISDIDPDDYDRL